MIQKLSGHLHNWFDTSFIVRFLLRLLGLYFLFRFVNWAFVGLITPEGTYSAFADRYLDYITPIRASVMGVGKLLAEAFGVPSQTVGDYNLQVENGGQLRMAWACIGLEIMSFWAAFALADTTPLRTKLRWLFTGLFSIWLINCLRVAILVIAKQSNWEGLLQLDQHDLFNNLAYTLVLLLMFVYYRKNKKTFEEK